MGGGSMRAAAKTAAFAGYRSSAARRAPTIPSASASSTVHVAVDGEPRPPISSTSLEKVVGIVSQWPSWGPDGWEITGGVEKEASISDLILDLPTRLVFGPPPSYEEAMEATTDLKVYLSTAIADDPIKVSQSSNLGESGEILPSVPKHVYQAFSLLRESSEAQTVVESVVSDKNVWEAVQKNPMVMKFCNKHQSAVLSPEESTGENETPTESYETASFFAVFVQKVKLKASDIKAKVSGMVSNISGILQNYMGSSTHSRSESKTDTGSGASGNYDDIGMTASFMALVVAVILVILLKRV